MILHDFHICQDCMSCRDFAFPINQAGPFVMRQLYVEICMVVQEEFRIWENIVWVQEVCKSSSWEDNTGCFFNCSAQISVLKRKTLFSQQGSFFTSRISWNRMSDWLPIIFHFGTENWEEQLKKSTLYFLWFHQDNYNKKIAPFSFDKVNNLNIPVNINVSMSIIDIIKIEEVDHVYTLKFRLVLEWSVISCSNKSKKWYGKTD